MDTLKHHLKKLIFAISLCLTFFISKAQNDFRPGYYITWEIDTVYGLIDFRGAIKNSDHCVFKADKDSSPVQFKPTDISGYRFNDSKFYISKKVEINYIEKQVFLEFLINGIADIFYYSGENSIKYFIEDRNGNLIELSNEMKDEYVDGKHVRRETLKYLGILKATLANCLEVQSDIDHAGLNHKSLINIGRKYHEYVCDNNEECIIYEKPVPALKFKIAPLLGMNTIKLSFPNENYFNNRVSYSDFNFESGPVPAIGFVLNVSVPQLNERLSVDFGSNVYQFNTHTTFRTAPDFITEFYDANLEFSSLQTSIALKYTFPKAKITPTISLGFASNFFLKKTQNVTIKTYYKEEEINSKNRSNYFPIVKDLHGLFAEMGTNFSLKGSDVFYSSIKYILLGNYKGNYADDELNGIKTKLVSTSICFGMYFGSKKK